MTDKPSSRLVVLISGSGTNLQAILDACGQSTVPTDNPLKARVCAVISNNPAAYGLARASASGVPGVVFACPKDMPRPEYDAGLGENVSAFNPNWVILAGWMRLLSANFLNKFPGRVINLHPALPGSFPGTHAIERAFEAFQADAIHKTGVMVHLVPDEGVDDGPVLGVEEVILSKHETLAELEERVHQVEHHLLISVLRQLTSE